MCVTTTPAFAAWHKAETDRFVIYSDSSPEDLRSFAEVLERYHVSMELETGRSLPVPSPSNRLTVYMVGSLDDLREIYGPGNSFVGGFYIPRANGSVTFVPNINLRNSGRGRTGSRLRRRADTEGAGLDPAMKTVLHEYAHHFLISSSRSAMPRWLSEGSAEYFSSARFNPDGSVDIGLPNNARAYEISQAAPVSLRELLDYDLYKQNRGNRYDAFYGRAWLLYHYLRFNPDRQGQLVNYWQKVATGMDSLEAGEMVFGDLDVLERELRSYGRERNMKGMRWPGSEIQIGAISTAALSEGHAAMMDIQMQSKRGVSREQALEMLPSARSIAQRYPEDAAALAALAEVEYDAGNDAAAIAAADRAIAIDPNIKNAYVQSGYAQFRQAAKVEGRAERKEAYQAAMRPFEALNALEPDHTQPLIYYYRSFALSGGTIPEDAKFALERATQLAPFDQRLAIQVAIMHARDGNTDITELLLAPVAADPHGGRQADIAKLMLAALEDAEPNSPFDLIAVRRAYNAARAAERNESE